VPGTEDYSTRPLVTANEENVVIQTYSGLCRNVGMQFDEMTQPCFA